MDLIKVLRGFFLVKEQNGHVGFMLSCYDAELSYDTHTDTFQARYKISNVHI